MFQYDSGFTRVLWKIMQAQMPHAGRCGNRELVYLRWVQLSHLQEPVSGICAIHSSKWKAMNELK